MLTENEIKQLKDNAKAILEPIVSKELLDYLETSGFYIAPASTKFHLNYEGGLCEHSTNVTKALLDLTESMRLTWQRPESPFIIGLLHDLCKADQYVKTSYGWTWNNNQQISGHGTKSVAICNNCKFKLTDEERACILYHMGSFTAKEEWSDYTSAIHTYPNVLYTHMADMIATHIIEK